MITELANTNLLTWLKEQTESSGIIHQCNCFHTMGAGIARQIAMQFPEAEKADNATLRASKDKLGNFSWARVLETPARFVYNFYGQYTFGHGRQTSYDAMVDGLEKIRVHAVSKGLTKLGLPFNMGCTLGGGDWSIARPIINSIFDGDREIDLWICRYEPK